MKVYGQLRAAEEARAQANIDRDSMKWDVEELKSELKNKDFALETLQTKYNKSQMQDNQSVAVLAMEEAESVAIAAEEVAAQAQTETATVTAYLAQAKKLCDEQAVRIQELLKFEKQNKALKHAISRAEAAEAAVGKFQLGFQHAEHFLNQHVERIRYLEAQNGMLQLQVSRLQV